MKHLLLILICCTGIGYAQKYTISGYVGDKLTQEKLIGALVMDTKSRLGTTSNVYGFFSLTLPSDSVRLVFSYVGFKPVTKLFYLKENTTLNVDLLLDNELKTIDVIAGEGDRIEEKSNMSTINIPVEQIKKVPSLFGEVDIIKVLQLLPGVKNGGEGGTGIYVRGGGPDQNLILLDGAPVYNVSHLFGFFSTFNSDAVKNVDLIKGGFPARYGGRLSSVIDINMKEGNMRRYNVEGSIGLISSRIMVEGPIWKNKTSFIVTARRTYLFDKILAPLVSAFSGGGASGAYYFYDLNAKINHKFSDKDRLFISVYNGLDKFSFKTGSELQSDFAFAGFLNWGNTITAARWNHVFNSKLFCNTSASYTRYKFGIGQDFLDYKNDTKETSNYFSGIYDWSGKINFDYVPAPDHYIKFGTHYTYHTFETGARQYIKKGFERDSNAVTGNPNVYATEMDVYAEDDWRITPRIKINAGVHVAGFLVQDNFYHSIQPRFSGRYLLPGNWSVKASYASMMQFIHLLSNATVGLPTDLWVPATKKIKPQESYQGALGVAKSFKQNMYEVSVEGYYKEMKNIIDYLDGANFLGETTDWESKVAQGRGWSYGAEFFLQKKKGKYTGWLGYTLSWTWRQFDEINFGKAYPYKYDRRHDISFVNLYKLSNKADIAVTWVYGTGNAISLPLQSYMVPNSPEFLASSDVQYYGSRNNYRMAPYHRLDLSINRHKKKKWGRVTWSYGVYNAYARRNPYFLYFSNNAFNRKQLKQVSLFAFVPSISYNFKFDFRNFKTIFEDDEELAEFEDLDKQQ